MLKRIFVFMSFGIFVGVCLFLARNAVAQLRHCDAILYPDDAGRIERWECFKNNGWVVEVVPDTKGNFPQTYNLNGDSKFVYQVTNIGGKSVTKADILVPICQPNNFNDPSNLTVLSASPSGTLYGPPNPYPVGFGDPNTGFGLGLTTVNTWVWNGAVGTLSITLQGAVLPSPNALLLNRGTANYAYGQILAPSCGITPTPFPPQVPLTAINEMTIDGIKVCIESENKSGCPTRIYSCSDQSVPVCECPDPEVWTKKTIKDMGVTKGKLLQSWNENNPRCPMTFLSIEGSCSQAGLTLSGYAYQSGTYASIEGYVKDNLNRPLKNVDVTACTGDGSSGCRHDTFFTDATGKFKVCIPALTSNPASGWSGYLLPSTTNSRGKTVYIGSTTTKESCTFGRMTFTNQYQNVPLSQNLTFTATSCP